MKPVHFVCACLMFASTFALAQFASARSSQSNEQPATQEPQRGMLPVPQEASSPRPRAARNGGIAGPRSQRRNAKPDAQSSPEQVLYTFQGGSDGAGPGGLIVDSKGNLYGETGNGGGTDCSDNSGCGTIFELTPVADSGWTETILHSFGATSNDGSHPSGIPTLDSSGNLYGTTTRGGTSYFDGTVFEIVR